MFLESNDITLKRLQEASCICGNISRECFLAAVSPDTLSDAKDNIRTAIIQAKDLSDTIINITESDPSCIPNTPVVRESVVEQLSRRASFRLGLFGVMAGLDQRRANATYEFNCAIRASPDLATLVGKIFENRLHKFLKTSSRTFTIESLDNRSANTKRFGDMECFSGGLALSVKSKTSCYLQPLFPSFDSFLYQPGNSQSGFSPLIALQVTTAANHASKIKGLEDVQTSLKPSVSGLKCLRPTTKRKMVILFVVPKKVVSEKQTIDGAKQGTKKKKETLWYKKTAQYILALSEEEVFKAT